MKKLLSVFLAALTIAGMSAAAYAEAPVFSDVNANEWYYDAVTDAADRGIMTGISDGVFSPNGKMTRAELVTVLARLSGEDVTGKKSAMKFSDTSEGAWYADYVGWGAETGIAGGYPDGTFKPNAPVQRSELAAFFVRYLKYAKLSFPDAPKIDSFSDSDQLPKWASDDIETLRRTGLIEGDGGCFNSEGKTTRAEFATVVSRYFEVLPSALDVMHSALENIMDNVELKTRRIYLKTGSTDQMTSENIGSLLFPQMGLDTSKYELIIDEEELEELCKGENYGGISPGNTFICTLNISIKNKVSEDVTETKKCNFIFEKTILPDNVYVDPDDFDSGIDANKYDEMRKRSIESMGDLSRLAKALAKAERGEDITVAYIGGSITEGAGGGDSECYARISANWLEKRYPDINVNYVNAGISGTPSILGNIRVNRDVLEYDPDIVFVEFAVNDGTADNFTESYESLVRTVLSDENLPAVILLFSPGNGGSYARQEFEVPIGEFYGLPMVSISNAINPAISDGLMTWSDFSDDGTHPNKWGHQVYSDMIEYFLGEARTAISGMTADELQIKPIREDSYTSARFVDLKFCDRSNYTPKDVGSWVSDSYGDKFEKGWTKRSYGSLNDPFVFEFTGSNVFLVFLSGDTFAHLLISVDGGDEFELYSGGDGMAYQLIASCSSYGNHTVSIRVKEDSEKNAHIFGFAFN